MNKAYSLKGKHSQKLLNFWYYITYKIHTHIIKTERMRNYVPGKYYPK